jgi:hypothetical protein
MVKSETFIVMYFGRMHRDGDRFFAQVLSLNSGSSGSLAEAAAMAPICGWACFLTAKKWNLLQTIGA